MESITIIYVIAFVLLAAGVINAWRRERRRNAIGLSCLFVSVALILASSSISGLAGWIDNAVTILSLAFAAVGGYLVVTE
ncbi:hypothetical protein [Natrialba sp. INN-245]|uniref:hypothetical protein n=1 Tax=Natrialba sp. INN-245 TaxID=2690967 RepID=UPI0013113848|nr:hypothetical protein [Natrialba sp. INN-245]MWV40561.1 hypothetical protein [Natrialba sp. INN-245]